MNERIRKIVLQSANEIADLFSPGFFNDRMVNDVAEINKKFAELIVQECVHVAVFKDDGMISTADVAGYMAAGRASAAKFQLVRLMHDAENAGMKSTKK